MTSPLPKMDTRTENEVYIDEQISKFVHDANTPDAVLKAIDLLSKRNAMVKNRKGHIDPSVQVALIGALITVLGYLVVTHEEDTRVITTKVLGLIPKGRLR